MKRYLFSIFIFWMFWAAAAVAGEADVLKATAHSDGDGRYRFDVTVSDFY